MPFDWPLALAIFFTIWWIALFLVLPLGVRSAEEAGEELPEGADRGAPAQPALLAKAGLTTLVAGIIFIAVTLLAKYV